MRHAFLIGEQEHLLWLSRSADGGHRLHLDDGSHAVALDPAGGLSIDGALSRLHVAVDGDRLYIHLDGEAHELVFHDAVARHATDAAGLAVNLLRAPMPGSVVAVSVEQGQTVAEGDTLVVIESMKMETAIRSPRDGVVETIHLALGQSFERDALLVTLADAGAGA